MRSNRHKTLILFLQDLGTDFSWFTSVGKMAEASASSSCLTVQTSLAERCCSSHKIDPVAPPNSPVKSQVAIQRSILICCFSDDKLYIEMELIEGASLQEHFTSLNEKNEKGMGEARLWNVFIQVQVIR